MAKSTKKNSPATICTEVINGLEQLRTLFPSQEALIDQAGNKIRLIIERGVKQAERTKNTSAREAKKAERTEATRVRKQARLDKITAEAEKLTADLKE